MNNISMIYEVTPHLYGNGEAVVVAFDADDEAQALTWAAADMHRADTSDDAEIKSAYLSARWAYNDSISAREGIVLRDERARAMVSILKRWVEGGPPRVEDQVTDAARMKSYKTACVMVAAIVKVPDL